MPAFATVACLVALACSLACRPASTGSPVPRYGGADIVLRQDVELFRGVVPGNTTLERLLFDHGLATSAVREAIASARSVFDPRRLRTAQPFELERTDTGALGRFDYEIDADTYLHVAPQPPSEGLVASVLPIPKVRREATAFASISEDAPSLYQAMDAAGERPELTIALADILGGEVDFNTDLQLGDRFGLLFEKFTREERAATYGAILAAELEVDGRVLRAIRFDPPDGPPAYYDEDGRSLRRFFLRSPLKFEPRITSGFSRRRFHPVLQTHRPHLGVDYGAPVGAPVVAVASGTVLSASYDRANGRMVRLRHARGYETYYLHLSSFASGVRVGRHVSQGDVIGRVGSTGLATGPHLDYRLRKNGVFVNPVREHEAMPPGDPIPDAARAAFEAQRDRLLESIQGRDAS